jgi:hypothetical protein
MGDALDPTNQDSPIGAIAEPIQKWTDPLSWATGGKWADITSKDLPKATNQALQPIAQPINKFDEAVNPLRKIPIVNNVANLAYAKPGDAIGLAIGSVFTGGALAGAAGAGEGGAAGAAGAGAAGGGAALGDGLAAGAALEGGGAAGAAGGAGFGLGGAGSAGIGTGIGTSAGATGGITGGSTGLSGFFGGAGGVGDAGLTGTVGTGASGLGTATAGDMGAALGSAPTGLFSGMLPGGGMTGTTSGALGGGISGATAGGSAIGNAGLGGFSLSGGGTGLSKNLKLASTVAGMGNKQQTTPQQNQANAAIQMRGGASQAHIPNGNIQQAGVMYGLPNGLLSFNQGRYA